MEIGKNLKKQREKLGLTQTDLANLLHYSDKTVISKIESGKQHMSIKKIEETAKVLGISAFELMYGSEKTPEQAAYILADVLHDPQTMSMLEGYLKLDSSQQCAVRMLIEVLSTQKK